MFNEKRVGLGLYQGLLTAASLVFKTAQEIIFGRNIPKVIIDAMKRGQVQKRGKDIMFVDIIVSLDKAPMAAAFELGSGIHSTQGVKAPYEIRPKRATFLRFPKEKWPQYVPIPGRPVPEIFIFPEVSHPGIEPRPYLSPAIEENADEIMVLLGQEFFGSIVIGADIEFI